MQAVLQSIGDDQPAQTKMKGPDQGKSSGQVDAHAAETDQHRGHRILAGVKGVDQQLIDRHEWKLWSVQQESRGGDARRGGVKGAALEQKADNRHGKSDEIHRHWNDSQQGQAQSDR